MQNSDRIPNHRVDGESPQSPRSALPSLWLAVPLAVVVGGLVWYVGDSSREPPALRPLGAVEQEGFRLDTGRATPPAAQDLSDSFVPASETLRQTVLQNLSELRADWKQVGPLISVTPLDVGEGAVAFSDQLDGWLAQYNLGTDDPGVDFDEGRISRAVDASGMEIHCREADRGIARDLARALAPALGGAVKVVYNDRASANRIDVFIESAPRFAADGVAYFPAVDDA